MKIIKTTRDTEFVDVFRAWKCDQCGRLSGHISEFMLGGDPPQGWASKLKPDLSGYVLEQHYCPKCAQPEPTA